MQQYAVFALGRSHGCAIDARGDARCFGNNSVGQAPPRVDGPFRHLALVDGCSCGLMTGGGLVCWGASSNARGCPAVYVGTPLRHFALSPAGFILLLSTAGVVSCLGDASAPGCAGAYPLEIFFTAVVATTSGGACALADDAGGTGSGTGDGGDAYCFGIGGTAVRSGPLGVLAAVGDAVCGLGPAADLQCWGPGSEAIQGAPLVRAQPPLEGAGDFVTLAGGTDPVVFLLSSQGIPASADGETDASRGCGAARCACYPGSKACRARGAGSAPEHLRLASAPVSTDLSARAQLTCGLACDMSLTCWGAAASDPRLDPRPAWLSAPCAISPPLDVGAPLGTSAMSCAPPPSAAVTTASKLARAAGVCNARGWWNNGTLFIDQAGTSLRLWPATGRFGSTDYDTALFPGQVAYVTDQGGLLAPGPPLLSAAFSADCALLQVAGGARWDVTRRCAVRYLRLTRGRAAAAGLANGSLPLPGAGAAPPGAPPQPLLLLAGVEAFDEAGALVSAGAALSASSAGAACAPAPGRDCASAATDPSLASVFASASEWGAAAAQPPPAGWLQLDFGRDVYLSRVVLRGASAAASPGVASALGSPSAPASQAALDALLTGVTLEGFDDRLPLEGPEPPADAAAAGAPAFRYVVAAAPAAAAATGARSYEWRGVLTACGYDPRASASSSPTTTPSGTASVSASRGPTPSGTSSPSGTLSGTRSTTGSPGRTPSRAATPTASRSTSPPATGSPTGTPSSSTTPSKIAAEFFDPVRAEAAAANVTNATAPYSWRSDSTLTSLTLAPDVDFQASTQALSIAWEPFEDVGSGVAAEAYCLGTAQFTCDLMPWTPAAIKRSLGFADLTGLNLTAGSVVYASVAAVNHVGLVAMASSNGVMVDDRAPALPAIVDTGKYFLRPDAAPGAGTVVYRAPVDINCDTEGTGIGAAWREVRAYSGVAGYEWAVGTAPNATDILAWTPIGDAVAVFNETLRAPAGIVYYASVRATGLNGAVSYASSDGVLVIDDRDAAAVMLCLPDASRSDAVGQGPRTPADALPPRANTFVVESAAA